MKLRTAEQIRERIRIAIVQEIQSTNIIALQEEPDHFLPHFLDNLTQQIHDLVLDEITFRRKQ